MTPRRSDPDVITRRLALIRSTLVDLEGMGEITIERLELEPITRAAVERFLQVLVDLAIDVNGHLLVSAGQPSPATARDSFLGLAKIGAISPALAEAIAPAASLRNLLVHRYADINLRLLADAVPTMLELTPKWLEAVATALVERLA